MVCHETFQNNGFSVGIEAKIDPLNIPIFGFDLIFLKEVRSRILSKGLSYPLCTEVTHSAFQKGFLATVHGQIFGPRLVLDEIRVHAEART